ncbi:MAG: metallophosphoesterase [Opitutaceae bacterium]|nr:metallophosphoesterase [Opitutaceae bacterium]
MVNWETDEPGDSVVEFGVTDALGERITREESVKLHHVEIPLAQKNVTYHYRVRSGAAASARHTLKGYPTDELRVAVVADTGFAKQAWAAAVQRENPHLLLSAGDHVPALHRGQPVARENIAAFSQLVGRSPELFGATPWLAALGNHDREIRPRGPKPPPEPVYDIEATAFRAFFALPGDEWHWHFDVPDFGVRFVALDLSHLSDMGTTWQTCHPYARDGVQFGWYRELMAASRQPFVITLYNERNSSVRGLEGGEWGRMIAQGSLAITGFGYFGERAEVNGFSFYNTSVSGTGTPYADPKSAVLKSEDNFVLLTFRREPPQLSVELKSLNGQVLDRKEVSSRRTAQESKP